MEKDFWKNPEGSIAVIVAIMLTVLIGFVGLTVDIGNLYVVRTRMQNAVDAAVCAGGLQLTDQSKATIQANLLITNNNFTPAQGQPTFDPTDTKKISYSLTENVSTNFMGLFGYGTVPITVSATAILQQSGGTNPGGPFYYALFSNLDLPLSGSRTITGSVHSNHGLTMSGGNNTITGAAEGATGVTISGSNQHIGSVQADQLSNIHISGTNNTIGAQSGGATNIAMPDYTQQIKDVAATTYTGNKTLSGSNNIAGNIHVTGNVTCSGVTVNGTGAILADGNITLSGTTSISGSDQVCLYSANGNITISGSINNGTNGSEIIYAPHGTVTISGNTNIHGAIIANQIIISGTLIVDRAGYPVKSLPGVAGKSHVKLIN
jgi:hypothetical protein